MKDRLVWAEISTTAYRQNLQLLRTYLKASTKMLVTVKANAYGHGAVELAKIAQEEKADYLGVVCLFEAKQLREAGITLPILILNYIEPEGAQEAINLDVDITVMDAEIITFVEDYAKESGKKPRVHVKVDTGMHRAGVHPTDAVSLIKKVSESKYLEFTGLFTHFATADEDNPTFTLEQITDFESVLHEMETAGIARPPMVSACNSAGMLRFPKAHYTMVRPGIATYGLSPSGKPFFDHAEEMVELEPVLSLKTQIVHIKNLRVGDSVGYGRTFVANKPMTVALLPVGYGDGFRRAPNNWREVLLHGKRAKVVGRVSMDQTTIDITNIPDVKVGDEVVLIGAQELERICAEEVAEKLGTINYEVVTGLSVRISRIYRP